MGNVRCTLSNYFKNMKNVVVLYISCCDCKFDANLDRVTGDLKITDTVGIHKFNQLDFYTTLNTHLSRDSSLN